MKKIPPNNPKNGNGLVQSLIKDRNSIRQKWVKEYLKKVISADYKNHEKIPSMQSIDDQAI